MHYQCEQLMNYKPWIFISFELSGYFQWRLNSFKCYVLVYLEHSHDRSTSMYTRIQL